MSAHPSYLTVLKQSDDCRLVWRNAFDGWGPCRPFLHPAFQEGLERLVPWDRVVIVDKGQPVMSGFVRSRGPVKDLVLPPFQPFSALAPDCGGKEIAESLRAADGLPKNWLVSFGPAEVDAGDTSLLAGYSAQKRSTYLLRTAPVDSAISAWSAGPRRQFRNATDNYRFWCSHDSSGQATAEAKQLDEVIHASVQLAEQAYARHKRMLPLPARGLARWASDLVYAEIARVYGLFDVDSGNVVAAIVALHDRRTAWYWIAGSEPGPGMTVLMAHVQSDLHQAGIEVLDLMGANTPGIAEFKRRFGGEHATYMHLMHRTLAGRTAEWAAQLFVPLVRKGRQSKKQHHEGA